MNEKVVLFIIFGGIGDFVKCKLYFFLFCLYKKGLLVECFVVIGIVCWEWIDEYYCEIVCEII